MARKPVDAAVDAVGHDQRQPLFRGLNERTLC
jgi:hypothetical protein